MRVRYLLIAGLACAGSQRQPERHSYGDHMEKARRYEQRAEEHERAAASAEGGLGDWSFHCGDSVLNDQLTTGGLRVTQWQPCLDLEHQAAQRHRRQAQRERDKARRERRAAAELVEAERLACTGLPARDVRQSPFARRAGVKRVDPLFDGEALAGVRVLLAPIEGATAESLGREIECQRARWALRGGDPQMMPTDPTLVEGTTVVVREVGEHFEVIVRGERPEQTQIALARARGELVEQTATR